MQNGHAALGDVRGGRAHQTQSFRTFGIPRQPGAHGRVHVFEAADENEELEFIAASIKKFVCGGERYFRISVMLADAEGMRPTLARVFSQYKIPYYIDERRPLSEHALSEFLCGFYRVRAAGGCAPDDVDGVLASPLFGLTKRERDICRNYLARWRLLPRRQ